MLLPRPEVTEHLPDELPTEFRCVSAFAPLMSAWQQAQDARRAVADGRSAGPAAPRLERAVLERFQRLMAAEGWPVQLLRMGQDRAYARERIALGHGSSSWQLRQLSLQLGRHYDDSTALH